MSFPSGWIARSRSSATAWVAWSGSSWRARFGPAGWRSPIHLFVSATRAPSVPNPHAALRDLPDREMLDELNRRYDNSVPDAILESQELRELFVPCLRADFMALETYEYQPMAPLTCPISVFGGERDTSVTAGMLQPWASETQGACEQRTFEGGHLFLQTAARHELVRAILFALHAHPLGSSGRDQVRTASQIA